MFGKNLIQDFSTEFDPRWIWTNFEMAEFEKPPAFVGRRVHFERNYIDKPKIAYCLATSYEWTKKLILIDLLDEGFSEHTLDVERPKIVASEHIANRYDVGSIYKIVVKLLDIKKNLISKNGLFEKTHEFKRAEIQRWLCIKHEFNCYPPGVRYISFESAGKDTRHWMGPYGVKMARASIVILAEENNSMTENLKSFDLSNLPIIEHKYIYKNPPNKSLLCNSYLRWRLFFEYIREHSHIEAHKNLCQLFGRPIVTIDQCDEYFREFRAVGLTRDDFLRTCNIEHANLCYEASSNLDRKKTNRKILDTSSLHSFEDFYHLIGFLTTELASRTDDTVLHLDEHTTTIVTPLCLVSFKNGGHRWSFQIPTDFDPQRIIEFEEPIARIFDESCLLTKAIMHMGRRMSLHEIICDIYECDPNNTWLSDEKLINLQLWDSHAQFGGPFFEWAQTWNGNSKAQMLQYSISEHLLDYSKELHNAFYEKFSGYILKYIGEPDRGDNRVWTDRELDWFANQFINKVNNKLLKHFNDNQDLIDAKFEILQRDIFLCGLYAFIENFMQVMLAALRNMKKPDEILSFYTKVWRTLMYVLDQIVTNMKEKFIEERPRHFRMIIKRIRDPHNRPNRTNINFNNSLTTSNNHVNSNSVDRQQPKCIDPTHLTRLRLLGEGYTSVVQLMSYRQPGKDEIQVAVKNIKSMRSNSEDSLREINLISECEHQNIVKFIGYYKDENFETFHIATEFMPGGDLHSYLRDESNVKICSTVPRSSTYRRSKRCAFADPERQWEDLAKDFIHSARRNGTPIDDAIRKAYRIIARTLDTESPEGRKFDYWVRLSTWSKWTVSRTKKTSPILPRRTKPRSSETPCTSPSTWTSEEHMTPSNTQLHNF